MNKDSLKTRTVTESKRITHEVDGKDQEYGIADNDEITRDSKQETGLVGGSYSEMATEVP